MADANAFIVGLAIAIAGIILTYGLGMAVILGLVILHG